MKWRGVARQRSVKIMSLPPVLRQWNWFVGRLSYRGRSLWRMCSSRSLAWFLVSRTQSALQQDCIPVDWSNTQSHNGRFPVWIWIEMILHTRSIFKVIWGNNFSQQELWSSGRSFYPRACMCAVKLDKILDTTHSKKSLKKAPSVLKVIRLLLFLRH